MKPELTWVETVGRNTLMVGGISAGSIYRLAVSDSGDPCLFGAKLYLRSGQQIGNFCTSAAARRALENAVLEWLSAAGLSGTAEKA